MKKSFGDIHGTLDGIQKNFFQVLSNAINLAK
jgi:hypothetical protein